MDLKGKYVLILGLARSGVAAAIELINLGAKVTASDIKSREELKDTAFLESSGVRLVYGGHPLALLKKCDLIVLSPGVPGDLEILDEARRRDIPVISELELGSRFAKAPIIAVTGTNGKTTTTTLIGEILKNDGKNITLAGNIGIPLVREVEKAENKDYLVVEVSSFQLENIMHFKPKVSVILNITEDHLNRHKTMDNYIAMKARIFENCRPDDWVVLNADDPETAALGTKTNAQVVYFSRRKELQRGAWVQNGMIILNLGNGNEIICSTDDIYIPGSHNLENALAASLMARIMGVAPECIADVLKSFKGVEHRIEFVDVISEVRFYNDSKGTNPDASIKAIQAMKGPTVLIAGGMDKDSSFDELIEAFDGIVTHMIVLGETADKLIRTAKEKGFEKVYRVNTVEESVIKAFSLAVPHSNVLFSPACASWDMFKDYEERGRVFKSAVKALKEEAE